VRAALDAYRFNEAAERLYHFTWHELCDWYLEAAKIPLAAGGTAADQTRGTLLHTLERLLRLLHPVMPFITEEIWQAVTSEGWGHARAARFPRSVMLAPYPQPLPSLADAGAEQAMERVITLVREVRNHRSLLQAPPSEAMAAAVVGGDAALEAARPLVEALGRCRLTFAAAPLERSGEVVVLDGFELHFPPDARLADALARIEKDLAGVEKEHGGVAKKLANPEFVGKAPEEVVEEVRAREAQLAARRAALCRQRDQLRAAG
jgi:valyl-tRNA synthetase